MTCEVRVRLHGPLVDCAGVREVTLALRSGAAAADVWDALAPAVRAMRAQCVLAVNDAWADAAHALAPGDVIDVIPPVSGG